MNQSVSSIPDYIEPFEYRLKGHIPSETDIEFMSDIWQLGSVSLDFSYFGEIGLRHNEWHVNFKPDIKIIAKILCVELSKDRLHADSIYHDFKIFLYVFEFMSKNSLVIIDTNSFIEFVEFYSMHTLNGNELIKRLSPRSGRPVFDSMKKLMRTNFVLSSHGIKPIFHSVREDHLSRILSKAVNKMSSGAISYEDWLSGGSLNTMTLDYGKYYIEYCDEFFEEHYPMAVAMSSVLKNRDSLIIQAGLAPNKNTINMFNKLLSGENVESVLLNKRNNEIRAKLLASIINTEIYSVIASERSEKWLRSASGIGEISKILKTYVNREDFEFGSERLRAVVEVYLTGTNTDVVNEILKESNVTIGHLKLAIDKAAKKIRPMALYNSEYYKKIGITREKSDKNISDTFLKKVLSAGFTTVIALTGWRASEFGFPFNAIKVDQNIDTLDQYPHPFRIHVNWHVFKTNGSTKLEREITYGTFSRINQIHNIVVSGNNAPCLYNTHKNTKNILNSKYPASTAVTDNWPSFATNYKGFHAIDQFEILETLYSKAESNNLTADENSEKDTLESWFTQTGTSSLVRDIDLGNARVRVRSELSRVLFFISKAGLSGKKEYLKKYRSHLLGEDSSLDSDVNKLLDQYLSDDTKSFIRNSTEDVLSNKVTVNDISSEVVSGCLYPAPHSFRHMWAEAVFRRFDGDVGWMIRSNFKHISSSMWLAYIQSKDNIRQQSDIRKRIVSGLLKKWIRDEGRESAGKLHRALGRIFSRTKFSSISDLHNAIDRYSSFEVESIKANPWGFCVSRKRSTSLARCAVNGSTRTENATPSLCLGCVNNLTKVSNIDYIIMHSNQHLELLESPILSSIPVELRAESIKYIESAFRIIKKIQPDQSILLRMHEAILKSAGVQS